MSRANSSLRADDELRGAEEDLRALRRRHEPPRCRRRASRRQSRLGVLRRRVREQADQARRVSAGLRFSRVAPDSEGTHFPRNKIGNSHPPIICRAGANGHILSGYSDAQCHLLVRVHSTAYFCREIDRFRMARFLYGLGQETIYDARLSTGHQQHAMPRALIIGAGPEALLGIEPVLGVPTASASTSSRRTRRPTSRFVSVVPISSCSASRRTTTKRAR